MNRILLIAAGFLVSGIAAQAQLVTCGLTLAKSGTGTTRTYTLGSATTVPASGMNLQIYPATGVTQSGTGATRTVTYAYGGIYSVYLNASNYCTDSVMKLDTVVGPINCAGISAYLNTSVSAGDVYFSSGITGPGAGANLAPGYSTTTTYSYGDGTSGISPTHTYTTSGSYTATATVICSHPTQPSCTKIATKSFSVVVSCNPTASKSGTGMTRTYTVQSSAVNPQIGFSVYNVASSSLSTSNTWTCTYSQPGYYDVHIGITGVACQDSILLQDTIVGPMNCANTGAYLYEYGYGNTKTLFSGLTGAGLTPGYTTTSTYTYGDGTSGTSNTHTYATGGSYAATVTIVCTHPSFPTCTKTATTTVFVPYGSCGSTLSKSGTGMTRTYLVQTNGVNPTFNALIYNTNTSYPISGSNSSFSHTYPQPGYYQVRVIVSGTNCLDTLLVTDTISGQLNCAALTHSMTASSSGQIGYFYLSGAATAPYPGYTRNVSYNYGDGTSGTSSNHSYTASGNYLTTATTTLSHPTYSTCTIVDTVTIQVTLPPNRIYASARWDSSLNAAGASMKFWLIQYDSTSQTLTAVDSALVAIAGGYTTSTIFNNEPVGSYRVKAHMLNQPASWTTHLLPTYGRSAAYWQNASTFRHNGFTSFSSVLMQQGAATSGPGFIGGLVTQGANRGGAAGDPMPNTTMILRDQSGVPVASTLTDAQGQYRFTNLAYSTYTVYPEALNYATTPSQAITLDATQPAAQGYNFRQELVARTFDPYFVPASVGNTTTALGVLVYPNPAQQTLYVRLADQAVSGTLEVYNLMGQRVKAQVIDLTQPLQELSTEGLANGTYLLHLPTAEGRQIHKIAVQH